MLRAITMSIYSLLAFCVTAAGISSWYLFVIAGWVLSKFGGKFPQPIIAAALFAELAFVLGFLRSAPSWFGTVEKLVIIIASAASYMYFLHRFAIRHELRRRSDQKRR